MLYDNISFYPAAVQTPTNHWLNSLKP